jgi:hypothetical protein
MDGLELGQRVSFCAEVMATYKRSLDGLRERGEIRGGWVSFYSPVIPDDDDYLYTPRILWRRERDGVGIVIGKVSVGTWVHCSELLGPIDDEYESWVRNERDKYFEVYEVAQSWYRRGRVLVLPQDVVI